MTGDARLCTREDMLKGGLTNVMKCAVCLRVSRIKVGWLDSKCTLCGSIYSEYAYDIVKKRREYLGFNRQEIAERAGITNTTVREYEKRYKGPSRRYFDLTEQLVKEDNEDE